MATVTVVTAERTLQIEATSIVDGEINPAGHLILTRHDGTPLDMGAVSGVQLDQGTDYAKADVFSYVGDTDPGAVPDGSVWFDTTGPSGPFASTTQQGLVELATSAETDALVDASRAVTPAGMAPKINFITGRLDALEALRVQRLATNALTETAPWTAYPVGLSQLKLSDGSGWSLAGGYGHVVTSIIDSERVTQTFYGRAGGTTGQPRMWVRSSHSSDNGGGWTSWHQVMVMINLPAASYTQTSLGSVYPDGMSRLYYTTATSTSWDFAGKAGEVLTFADQANGFRRQIFTEHGNGSSATPAQWFRTSGSSGWTPWRKQVFENKMPKAMLSGRILVTPSAANTPTSEPVSFPAGYFSTTPNIVVGQDTTVPGTQVTGVACGNPTATGFNAIVTRTNTTSTWVQWIATEF